MLLGALIFDSLATVTDVFVQQRGWSYWGKIKQGEERHLDMTISVEAWRRKKWKKNCLKTFHMLSDLKYEMCFHGYIDNLTWLFIWYDIYYTSWIISVLSEKQLAKDEYYGTTLMNTHKLINNTIYYNSLDTTCSKDGSQKYINYFKKWS